MIEELRIGGLGVIDEAAVTFAPGLTVLTGETGAGKTMVLTGLDLARGGRTDSGSVRTGAGQAVVDSVWRLAPGSRLLPQLDEAGLEIDVDDEGATLILSRVIAEGGRSRAFAGGRAVPASMLTDLTEWLVAVHGQADQLLLRDSRRQRELLDLFAGEGLASLLDAYRADLSLWRRATAELRDLVDHRQEREREAALLRHGIDEIAAVSPEPGEDETLKSQANVLAHATDLVDAVGVAHETLAGDDRSAASILADVHRLLERARALDPALGVYAEQLDTTAEALSALAGELAAYVGEVDADPARLEAVEERRQAISQLKRRYGPGLDDVLAWWRSAEETVAAADDTDVRIAALRSEEGALRDRVTGLAERLSSLRVEAAEAFGRAATGELRDLAMADATLVVEVRSVEAVEDYSDFGRDAVEVLLSPHAGAEPRPLGKGASGGELSRIMLALEVVLAGRSAIPTLVFDEVDAGIGGRVAVEVGRRLSRLARSNQVIVVTHLPQVAAFADRHVVVAKGTDGQVTSASVVAVEGEARVRELVRMLSGLEDSASGAEHAEELLALAADEAAS